MKVPEKKIFKRQMQKKESSSLILCYKGSCTLSQLSQLFLKNFKLQLGVDLLKELEWPVYVASWLENQLCSESLSDLNVNFAHLYSRCDELGDENASRGEGIGKFDSAITYNMQIKTAVIIWMWSELYPLGRYADDILLNFLNLN